MQSRMPLRIAAIPKARIAPVTSRTFGFTATAAHAASASPIVSRTSQTSSPTWSTRPASTSRAMSWSSRAENVAASSLVMKRVVSLLILSSRADPSLGRPARRSA